MCQKRRRCVDRSRAALSSRAAVGWSRPLGTPRCAAAHCRLYSRGAREALSRRSADIPINELTHHGVASIVRVEGLTQPAPCTRSATRIPPFVWRYVMSGESSIDASTRRSSSSGCSTVMPSIGFGPRSPLCCGDRRDVRCLTCGLYIVKRRQRLVQHRRSGWGDRVRTASRPAARRHGGVELAVMTGAETDATPEPRTFARAVRLRRLGSWGRIRCAGRQKSPRKQVGMTVLGRFVTLDTSPIEPSGWALGENSQTNDSVRSHMTHLGVRRRKRWTRPTGRRPVDGRKQARWCEQ